MSQENVEMLRSSGCPHFQQLPLPLRYVFGPIPLATRNARARNTP